MGRTLDLGRRVELVSMDRHFHDITIGLYEQATLAGPVFQLHTYSQRTGADERIEFLNRAMEVLGGLQRNAEGLLQFPCGHRHLLAVKRVFLETWKLPSTTVLQIPSLTLLDKKCNSEITAQYQDQGRYQIVGPLAGSSDDEEVRRRATVYARGLLKLAELNEVAGENTTVEFPCKQSHHALVGLLMIRAGDVRTAMREAAMMAARGVLAAPSNQATDVP